MTRSRPGLQLGALCLALLAAATGCSVNPPLRLDSLTERELPLELADVPFHPQEEHHCGPASLLMLLEHSGVEADYDAVVRRVYVPGLEGSLQVEMLATARDFGRIAYPLPPEPEAVLAELATGRPVLTLLNLGVPSVPVWHYAVVVGFDPARNRMILRSGDTPRSVQRAPSWLRRWDWGGRFAMVLLRPGEWPATPRREALLRAFAAFEDTARPVAVEQAWQAAVEHWPDEPIAWLGLGNAAHRLQRWEAARAAYRRVLELDPQRLAARLNLALSFAEEGRGCEGKAALGPRPDDGHPLETAFLELEERLRSECPASEWP